MNPAPGFGKYPDHRIATKQAAVRVRVRYAGETIADTQDAVALEEAMSGSTVAPIVYYVPRKDVNMARLARSGHASYCPFKGHASYYSLRNGPQNVVWSYEQPYDEMAVIRERLAFYPDKVEVVTG